MITPERKIFIEKAKSFLLNDIKYNINPNFKSMELIIILYWLYKLEDYELLTVYQKQCLCNIIHSIESTICIPEIINDSNDCLLLEDGGNINTETVNITNKYNNLCNC